MPFSEDPCGVTIRAEDSAGVAQDATMTDQREIQVYPRELVDLVRQLLVECRKTNQYLAQITGQEVE